MRISDWSSDMCSSDLDEADSAGDDEGLVGKQRQWQYRFSGSVLDEDEACERHHGDGNHSKNDRRIPGEAVSAQTSEKDQSGKLNSHQRVSGDSNYWPPPLSRRCEGAEPGRKACKERGGQE